MINEQSINIEKATTQNQFEELFEIRRKVFVQEQKVDESEEYDEFEESSTHFIAYCNANPVGTCRYRKTEKGVKLERFAVLKEYRGKHIGAALLGACVQDNQDQPYVYMHAQEHAVEFYKKYGFITEGELFYECEIPHYKMRLK